MVRTLGKVRKEAAGGWDRPPVPLLPLAETRASCARPSVRLPDNDHGGPSARRPSAKRAGVLASAFPPTVDTVPMRCRPVLTRLRAASVLLVGALLCLPSLGYGQETPEIEATISVSTDAGGAETLPLGIDPNATAGVDSEFGESELPPVPPSGVFDVRWVDDVVEASFGQGLPVDIREGSPSSTGTRQHKLQFQSEDAATEVTIEWDLPGDVIPDTENHYAVQAVRY